MKIEFYYWDMQCPVNNKMLKLFEKYSEYFEISLHNIKDDFETSMKQRIFFPTLTVIDDVRRYFSPLTDKFFNDLLNNRYPEEKPFIINHGREVYTGEIFPMTKENIELAGTCTGGNCSESSHRKLDFLNNYNLDIFGFVNIKGNALFGGVEYLPSTVVPYNIPKSEDTAFLTCVYKSSEQYDYKTGPFKILEQYLTGTYARVIAIADEVGTFPNGDLKWFIDNGFKDEGVISYEPGYCKLHLVSKMI